VALNERLRVVAVACLVVLPAFGALDARAQGTMVTNLTCQLRGCTGEACTGVAQTVALSIDVEGARARGGEISDWVAATIEPDLVTFSLDVSDAAGTAEQTYAVSRTSLGMTWRRSSAPATPPTTAPGAVARYQCRLVHAQF
jgi:hypothetical protein